MERKVSVVSVLGTVILILLSFERVTTVGLYEGKCTVYQTVSVSERTFDLASNGIKMNNLPFVILFFIGILLLFVPGFALFNQSKSRSIISIALNLIGTILVFILFNSCQYMYMMILISLLIASNIFIRIIENYKNRIVDCDFTVFGSIHVSNYGFNLFFKCILLNITFVYVAVLGKWNFQWQFR